VALNDECMMDVQILFLVQVGFSPQGVSEGLAESLARNFNLREDILYEFLSPVEGRDAFFLIVDYGRPKSRGNIRLKSVDFRDDVIIDPKYYEDARGEDIRVTVEGMMYIQRQIVAFLHD